MNKDASAMEPRSVLFSPNRTSTSTLTFGLVCFGLRCVVVVTQYASQLPASVFVLPQLHEARFSRSVSGLGLGMQKPMHSHLDCSITLHVIDLQRARHQHPLCVASTNIIFDTLGELLAAQRYAALVMVKLNVIRQQAVERLQVTVVVSVEELCIQRGNGLVQVSLIL